jgi:hypothetical protein
MTKVAASVWRIARASTNALDDDDVLDNVVLKGVVADIAQTSGP